MWDSKSEFDVYTKKCRSIVNEYLTGPSIRFVTYVETFSNVLIEYFENWFHYFPRIFQTMIDNHVDILTLKHSLFT